MRYRTEESANILSFLRQELHKFYMPMSALALLTFQTGTQQRSFSVEIGVILIQTDSVY